MVLGFIGLGGAWRAATASWAAPPLVGELLILVGAAVWATVLTLYCAKWLVATAGARAEMLDPVQCCFIGLAGVATMLVAIAAAPYARDLAVFLFTAGSLFTVAFAVWRSGTLWKGGRDPANNTPALYLPTVAGGFVTATAASSLGFRELAMMAFGAAFLSWIAIESVLLHRLYTAVPMALGLRPTLGIQLAPPTVGGLAYASLPDAQLDILAYGLLGYGVLQALLLVRLLPWIHEQRFTMSYWGFAFGATALGALPLRLLAKDDAPLLEAIAPYFFGAANVAVAALVFGTLRLGLRGRLPARKLA
jgi:tellurite resistance protein